MTLPAPNTSTYLLRLADQTNLPNSLVLTTAPGLTTSTDGLGNFIISPAGKLASVQSLTTTGFMFYDSGTATVNRTTLGSTLGTIAITNIGGSLSGTSFDVVNNTNTQRVKASVGGTLFSTRSNLNFIGGAEVNISISDDNINDRANITISAAGASSSNAPFILQTPYAGLTAAQALSALSTGILKSTTATGVVSIAVAGTDYLSPTSVIPVSQGGTGLTTILSQGLIIGEGSTASVLSPGTNGTVLSMVSGSVAWVSPPASFTGEITQNLVASDFISSFTDNHVAGGGGSVIFTTASGTGSSGSILKLRQTRGAVGAFTPTQTGDSIGLLTGYGQTATSATPSYNAATSLNMVATENWSGTANGSAIKLSTVGNGTIIPTLAVTIDQDQSVTLAGALNATHGGSLGGTYTGTPTLSGNVIFSGTPSFTTGGALAGTFTGTPTLSGNVIFSGTPSFTTGAALAGTFSGTPSFSGTTTYLSGATLNAASGSTVGLSGTTTIADCTSASFSNGFDVVGGASTYHASSSLVLQSTSAFVADSGSNVTFNNAPIFNGIPDIRGGAHFDTAGTLLVDSAVATTINSATVNINSTINQSFTSGNIGINTVNDSAIGGGGHGLTTYSGTTGLGGAFTFATTRGTLASPTAITSGNRLGLISATGYQGVGFATPTALITVSATENWSATANGTQISFSTTPNTTAAARTVATLGQDGILQLPYGATFSTGSALTASAGSTTTFNNTPSLNAGAVLSGILTSSSASLSGVFAGSPAFSGNVLFAGTPSFSVGSGSQTVNIGDGSHPTTLTILSSSAVSWDSGSTLLSNGDNRFVTNVGMGASTAATHTLQLFTDDAAKTATTTWTVTSDARIKTNVTDVEEALPIINALTPRKYQYTQEYLDEMPGIDASLVNYGFIADEVEKVMPSCVVVSANKIGTVENIKVLNIHNINILMIQAVKELSMQLDALKSEIDAMKASAA